MSLKSEPPFSPHSSGLPPSPTNSDHSSIGNDISHQQQQQQLQFRLAEGAPMIQPTHQVAMAPSLSPPYSPQSPPQHQQAIQIVNTSAGTAIAALQLSSKGTVPTSSPAIVNLSDLQNVKLPIPKVARAGNLLYAGLFERKKCPTHWQSKNSKKFNERNVFFSASHPQQQPIIPAGSNGSGTVAGQPQQQPIVLTQAQFALLSQSGRLNLAPGTAAAAPINNSTHATATSSILSPGMSQSTATGTATSAVIIKTEPFASGMPTVQQAIPQRNVVAAVGDSADVSFFFNYVG